MPAPVVSRKNSVTYGGFAMGGSTEYHIHSVTASDGDYNSLEISFQVFVQHDTVSSFVALCTALEAAMRVPNGDLLVVVDGTDWYNFTQSGNTGMLGEPAFSKSGGGGDSNNSRIYDCSVKVMRPADETGKNGRLSSQVSYIENGAEILHLDVSAVYTAISGGGTALAQAQAQFPGYLDTLKLAGGGTWDDVAGTTYAHDSDNKVCRCKASYRNLLVNQSQGTTNDTTLHGVVTSVSTDRAGIGADPGGSAPLVKISVNYACEVRSKSTTDLRATYTNTVRPHMIATASAYADDISQMTAVVERPGLGPDDNTIRARMVFLAPGGSSLIRADTNVAMIERLPFFFEPILDGDDYSRDKHNRPGYKAAAIVSTVLLLGTGERGGAGSTPFALADAHVARLAKNDYHVIEKQEPVFKQIEFDGMGISGSKLNLVSIRRTVLMEKARVRNLHGGGGGGATRTRTRSSGQGNQQAFTTGNTSRTSGSGWID